MVDTQRVCGSLSSPYGNTDSTVRSWKVATERSDGAGGKSRFGLVYRLASRPFMEEHASESCSVGNGGEEKGQADTDTGTFPEETARHLRSQ